MSQAAGYRFALPASLPLEGHDESGMMLDGSGSGPRAAAASDGTTQTYRQFRMPLTHGRWREGSAGLDMISVPPGARNPAATGSEGLIGEDVT